MASPGAADLAIDDNWQADLLNELREVRHEIDSIPKKWELRLVAYVILGAVGSLFIFRDIIAWLFFCIDERDHSAEDQRRAEFLHDQT
jgi:hypothetical protein